MQTLHVYAENSISWHSLTWEALVIEGVCDPAGVSLGSQGLTWDNPRIVTFTQFVTVHGVVILNCEAINDFNFE